MIFIKSKKFDATTYDVEKWLNYYDCKYKRINNHPLEFKEILIKNNQKEINIKINIEDYILQTKFPLTFWFRQSDKSNFKIPQIPDFICNPFDIYNNIYDERKDLKDYIYEKIIESSENRRISNPFLGNINKLLVLDKAKKIKIQIPDFIITNKKKYLKQFINKNKKIIIKPLSNIVTIKVNDSNYLPYSTVINQKMLDNLPVTFFPSFFQQYIDKLFEIRTFYLNEKFYSMAMFTQTSKKTKVDFRNYDYSKPNRTIPFNLPKYFEDLLLELFKQLKINSGSVDIIYGIDKKYYFLEINPVGQFGMVSKPCNYYLEQKIAKELYKYEESISK